MTLTTEQLTEMDAEAVAEHIAALSETVEEQARTIENFRAVLDNSIQRRKALEERIDELEHKLDDVERDVGLTQAAVPEQSKQKVENVCDVLEYAATHASGGYAGTAVTTGEVTAAIDGSRSTARRLMDDIAGRFEWATAENPGGPNPKKLKLAIKSRAWEDLQDEIIEEYRE
jgi:regulator of replication initiation timing